MEKLSKWLKARRDTSGDRDVWFFRTKRETKTKNESSCYQQHHAKPLPQERRRSLNIYQLEAGQTIPCSQGSRLLNLPAEIRLLIWEHVFTGNLIGLYRVNKRLYHSLMDDTNTEASIQDIPLSVEGIREVVTAKYGSQSGRDPKRLGVIPLLQSCRLIYSEGLDLLYSGNTFVFLQNETCGDFLATIVPERLASIRSIHWHWQVSEAGGVPRWFWSKDQSLWLLNGQNLPQLNHISLFIQGPICFKQTYEWILSDLKYMNLSSAKTAVLRLPNPERVAYAGYTYSQGVDELIEESDLLFTIVRPSRAEFEDAEDHDLTTVGWRCGTVFLPQGAKDEGASGFVMKRYTFWTPMPPGIIWPCFA